ncbi:hypothetical protein AB0D89_32375 [Streptomyces luteogriseus]|uniref:hypothetical protein n=1 Tax=Streptomyces luteogriseus TaxID=68233 RepID=UPI0033F5B8A6
MLDEKRSGRDLRNFVLPELGQLLKTGDPWEPYRVLDERGRPVEPAALYLKELMARDSSPLTPRSYGMEAEREGWLGEIEGLQSSLTHAEEKLAQLDAQICRKKESVDLGIPTFREIVARTTAVGSPSESL